MNIFLGYMRIVLTILIFVPGLASAVDDPAAIEKAIAEHQTQIEQLNKDIAEYQVQLDQTSVKKQTLQNTLSGLNLSIKKVTASVNLTKNQIGSTQLEIQKLKQGIVVKENSIDTGACGRRFCRVTEA